MTFKTLLRDRFNNKFAFFDGAMGTMLQKEGLKVGELPETLNITNPEIIKKVHKQYIDAGSDIVITNTFGANELKYSSSEYSIEQVITAGVNIAREAAGNKLVALDIGPTGLIMEPTGTLSFEAAYELFKKQVIIGEKAGADLILIETMSDLYEVKAAVLAAKENSSLPVFCTMTFQQDGRTLMGTDPKTMVFVLEGLGVDALGVNCSLGPKELMPIIDEILLYASIPVMVQPNAGLPRYDGEKTVYDIEPNEFAKYIRIMAQKGVQIFGGCCGTNPEFIKESLKAVEGLLPLERESKNFTAICSGTETIILDGKINLVGERINPTGKKRYKEELKEEGVSYIQAEAVKQKEEGAAIIGLNVGLPEIDERKMMIKAVKAIQKVVQLPIDIDSPNPEVLEAGARVYNGRPIINSVNGKKEIMKKVFPIVKKYGGCVIALTIDENGIPDTAEGRLEIAEKIVNEARNYGIDKKDIIIDCLALTVSAQQKEVLETVKAIKLVKEKLGVKTVLGVSNISYGMPRRDILNRTFLALALQAGLDLPIINSADEEMKATIHAFEALANIDKEGKNYINKYSAKGLETKSEKQIKAISGESTKDLKRIIVDGMEEEAVLSTEELLKTKDPMEIVNGYIIPALDYVGEQYDEKEIFLPQLIQSAETVKKSFEVIKENMIKSGKNNIEKGKIVLATVKGDIHDIGKNIVKVLLENYGFKVIDLGKDVPIEKVVEAVKEDNIKLVGLSALMTTTVINMKKTIEALRENNLDCKVFVGGAVLNEEYAQMIGADFYARDARESVRIAEKIFIE
ncbi:homocysteine S-methyltransferase family protein [Clostridium aciditolerans]|uniref:Methionine synthase n=1 Tax=Clostridium aciditolerans TaxID=339861 RepID=A0A934I0Y1_9CLOT|nr:homocysteine S-methyltransferase family protein [Clostridium aciditolerans]MBI6874097.1 homocysteine S-methyltransferase family protein [Clostridium aciditolerans]